MAEKHPLAAGQQADVESITVQRATKTGKALGIMNAWRCDVDYISAGSLTMKRHPSPLALIGANYDPANQVR
jgi:hypothetical protein